MPSAKGIQAFDTRDRRHKVMILVTDGESLEGDPQAAAEEAKQAGVVIYSIGVGTAAGEPIPLRDERGNVTGYKKDEAGSVVVSRLDEESLRQVSGTTGGQYYRATPAEEEVEKIVQAVSGMDKKEFESKVYLTYVDRFQIPLGIALFFIFVESLISDAKSARSRRWFSSLVQRRALMKGNRECETPNRGMTRRLATTCENERPPLDKGRLQGGCAGLFAATVSRRCRFLDIVRYGQAFLLVFIFAATTGQIWRDKVSRKNAEGNVLYEQKNFPEALDKYVEANDGKSHRQELAYNLANAFYQQKKYQEALQELEKAIASGNSSLNEKIHFNRGNTFFQMGKYQEAIEAYKKALELDPGDKEAKHNLELALKKLQENPQEQQKDSKNKDQQSKQDKQDKAKPEARRIAGSAKTTAAFTTRRTTESAAKRELQTRTGSKAAGRAAAESRHGSEGSAPYSGRSEPARKTGTTETGSEDTA